MSQNLNTNEATANHSGAMETGNHFKNGASSKSQTSRENQLSAKMNRLYASIPAILIASVFLLSGCASIVTKSTYPVSINSNPTNAKISITDKVGKEIYLGNTPATVKLKAGAGFFSKAEYQVKFSSPGYDDKIVPVTFKLDGWYFGNILLGGLVGMLIVDPATGAMWKIETEFLNETLSRITTLLEPEMKILSINDIPENWKNHLVKVN